MRALILTSVLASFLVTAQAQINEGANNVNSNSPAASSQDVGQTTKDAAITTGIKTKLLANPVTSSLRINVVTNGGVVTLTGYARSEAEKNTAERLAKDTNGVTEVHNRIELKR